MSFDVGRLRPADRIVAAGAIGLFVFVFFFAWLGATANGTALGTALSFHTSVTGWEAFTDSRWVWLATILAALALVALIATGRQTRRPIAGRPVSLSTVVAALGGLSTLLILYRIAHHPHGSLDNSVTQISWGIRIGIWLGLIAAAAIAYGGYRAAREEDAQRAS